MKKLVYLFALILSTLACKNEASEQNIYALLVSKQNNIVQEEYFNGKIETDLVNIQSITKSIVSLLLGIAIDQGYIASEEVLLQDFFKGEDAFINRQQKGITIKHILNHTSGLEWNGFQEHAAFLSSQSPTEYVMDKKVLAKPGEVYNYNSGAAHLISIIIEKATGQTCLDFANQHLFQPLSFEPVIWDQLNDGHCDGAGFGLSLQPKDLLKIGELIAGQGKFEGEQLISEQWIKKITNSKLKRDTNWGFKNSKHGYGWYSQSNGINTILYAMGYGGQFLIIIPSKSIVITAAHNHDTPNGIEQQLDFLNNTFPQIIKGI